MRIIPRLDIKGDKLVKGVQLEGLRVLGSPEEFAEKYYQDGADELIYIDCVASLYGRKSIKKFILKTAKNIFIPLCVGGGIRSINDIENILQNGADKVAINTAAVNNPSLINKATRIFGSSTIVISIQAVLKDKEYFCYIDNGREPTKKKVLDWSKEIEDRGAGEILITNVNKDGTGEGLDLNLIKNIHNNTKIPIIASGGVGSPKDVLNLYKKTKIEGIAISSMFHYDFFKNKKSLHQKSFRKYDDILLNKNFELLSIKELKNYLIKNNINIRSI